MNYYLSKYYFLTCNSPEVIQKTELGLKHLIINSIKKSTIDNDRFKENLLNNIVLSGGTTMMPGFSERVFKEITEYTDNDWELDCKPNIITENNRYISKWIGMSMIASMSSFEKLFIKKAEYQELGDDHFSLLNKIF